MIGRRIHDKRVESLKHSPTVALLGPRQAGKTMLASRVYGFGPCQTLVVYPGRDRFPLDAATDVLGLAELGKLLQALH